MCNRRMGPRDLIPECVCCQCKHIIDPGTTFCWNLQCPKCPAYEEPWEHLAAQQRAMATGNSAHVTALGSRYEFMYRKFAPVKWIDRRLRCGRPVQNVNGITAQGVVKYVIALRQLWAFDRILIRHLAFRLDPSKSSVKDIEQTIYSYAWSDPPAKEHNDGDANEEEVSLPWRHVRSQGCAS